MYAVSLTPLTRRPRCLAYNVGLSRDVREGLFQVLGPDEGLGERIVAGLELLGGGRGVDCCAEGRGLPDNSARCGDCAQKDGGEKLECVHFEVNVGTQDSGNQIVQ